MHEQSEREYHLVRQKECREMARHASSDPARLAHEALAQEHARRAKAPFERTLQKV